jgi:hypothetical protein
MGEGASTRRRVLVVVSAWCPAMIADMQRARMLAWEMPALGWDVEVLTPQASEIRQDVIEPDPTGFFAPGTPVHQVGSIARGAIEALGSRTHAWRTWLPMWLRGRELLRSARFDLIYFTTTTFIYFALGPRWYREFHVPYLLDFHDPWVKGNSAGDSHRSLRSKFAQRLAERMERAAVASARGIVSVSPRYLDELRKRYSTVEPAWLETGRHAVIPFGAREGDYQQAPADASRELSRCPAPVVLTYVGAGGAIMVRSFELICRAFAAARFRETSSVNRVLLELHGTTYGWRPEDRKVLEEVAQRTGIGDLVREHPERVAYRRSLELLRDSDGAIVLGVDDAGYMPSKLFSCALSGKPLLASLHRDSAAFSLFESTPELGQVLWFDGKGAMPIDDAARVVKGFLDRTAASETVDRRAMLEAFLAPRMARRHAELFAECLDS